MNDLDINKLMEMLSKMDKKDLENGLANASKVLQNSSKDELLKKLNNLDNTKNSGD